MDSRVDSLGSNPGSTHGFSLFLNLSVLLFPHLLNRSNCGTKVSGGCKYSVRRFIQSTRPWPSELLQGIVAVVIAIIMNLRELCLTV